MSFAEKFPMSRVRRAIIAYLVAALLAYVAASIFQSLFVLVKMTLVGADFPVGKWLQTIFHDLYGFAFLGMVSYAGAVFLGFVIAMPAAAVIHRFSRLPRWFLYPLAGATAMATLMEIIKMNFYGATIFPGTRGATGFLLQLLAGALGGALFATLSKSRS